MILGLGQDMVDIHRIEKTLARFGERFIQRVFTPGEQDRVNRRRASGPRAVASGYAKRYAAKEACFKALGTQIGQGISWREMEVVNALSGQPSLRLTGAAARRLESLAPPGMRAQVHLSLTDEYPLAQATVILSALPD